VSHSYKFDARSHSYQIGIKQSQPMHDSMEGLIFAIAYKCKSINPTSLLVYGCYLTPHYIRLILCCSIAHLRYYPSSYKYQIISS